VAGLVLTSLGLTDLPAEVVSLLARSLEPTIAGDG
jgi:hypothetical protein